MDVMFSNLSDEQALALTIAVQDETALAAINNAIKEHSTIPIIIEQVEMGTTTYFIDCGTVEEEDKDNEIEEKLCDELYNSRV